MGWNLDTSIKGGGTGNHIARHYTYAGPQGDVPPGGGVREWVWYGIGVPAGARRVEVLACPTGRAGANAAGYFYLILQTPDGGYHELSSVRFHNNTMWWSSWNHTLMGARAIPHGGTVNVWVDMYNDAGSGTNAYPRYCHFNLNWFN